MDKVIITKDWCKKNILLTKTEEYELGDHCTIPTVSCYLPCTDGLIELADDIRKQKMHNPHTKEDILYI